MESFFATLKTELLHHTGLHVNGRPLNNTELRELTSYSYESIKPALSFLEHIAGLISCNTCNM